MANRPVSGGGEWCRPGGQALARLLETPQLAETVPRLAPEIMQGLIRHAGLERCVGLVEAATADQLRGILDLELWGFSPSGNREVFDAQRFGEWIEALVDRDAAAAARIVARLDLPLVLTGLSRYVRVLDPGVLEPTAPTDDEWESGLFACDDLSAEIGGFIVQARRRDAWDAVVGLLVELSAGHRECFQEVMRGCRRLSDGDRERDGLDDLLERPEQQLHDVAAARDERRAEHGFTAATDARAFLAMARQGRSLGRQNPIAVAYLRRADAAAPLEAPRLIDAGPHRSGTREPSARLSEEREAAGLSPLLEYLRKHRPDVCLARERELAFLANTLVAGGRLQSRPFTPPEASAAVVATCSLGLLREPVRLPADHLVGHDLIGAFEDGWTTLHREVSLFVASGLLAILRGLSAAHSDTLEGLVALRRSLETHLAADTPWLAQDALDVLSTLDTPAWHGLLGLLSECPVIPAVVTAIVERRTGPIDPKAFTFVATTGEIDTVRAFMARLPALLAG